MNNKPILFFSQNDTNSKEIWNYIKSKNMLENFIKISTDNNRKIPAIITETPSILIKGRPAISGMFIKMYLDSFSSNNAPQTNQVVDNSSNFQSSNTSSNFQSSNNSSQNNNNGIPDIKTSTNNLNGIKDFNAVEMGSNFSDNYSFIENDTPMSFCYQFLDEKNNNS